MTAQLIYREAKLPWKLAAPLWSYYSQILIDRHSNSELQKPIVLFASPKQLLGVIPGIEGLSNIHCFCFESNPFVCRFFLPRNFQGSALEKRPQAHSQNLIFSHPHCRVFFASLADAPWDGRWYQAAEGGPDDPGDAPPQPSRAARSAASDGGDTLRATAWVIRCRARTCSSSRLIRISKLFEVQKLQTSNLMERKMNQRKRVALVRTRVSLGRALGSVLLVQFYAVGDCTPHSDPNQALILT